MRKIIRREGRFDKDFKRKIDFLKNDIAFTFDKLNLVLGKGWYRDDVAFMSTIPCNVKRDI